MKLIKRIIIISILLSINSLILYSKGGNFYSVSSKIGTPELKIPLIITTSFDKVVYIQNNYMNSYHIEDSKSMKELIRKNFFSNYTYLNNDFNISSQAIFENVKISNSYLNLIIGHSIFPELTNTLTIPYMGFIGLGRIDEKNKELNFMNQLQENNLTINNIIFFQNTSKYKGNMEIYLGEFPNNATQNLNYVVCKYNKKYEFNRVCNFSHLIFGLNYLNENNITQEYFNENSISLNGTVEFIFENSLYSVFPSSYKKYFERKGLNDSKNCYQIFFYLFPTWKCLNDIFNGIHIIINKQLINIESAVVDYFGSTLITIIFRDDIDRIQLSIPMLSHKTFKFLFNDNDETITIISNQSNIFTSPFF